MMANKEMVLQSRVNRWKILNATTLKLVAVTLMFLDHIHQMFVHVGAPMWLTMLGRPVFPIFLFVSAESFYHTHSKKKYLQRLLWASWGMTLFTVALQAVLPNDDVVLMNNAFGTFFITVFYMMLWDIFLDGIQKKNPGHIVKAILCSFLPVVGTVPLFFCGRSFRKRKYSVPGYQSTDYRSDAGPQYFDHRGRCGYGRFGGWVLYFP